MLYLEMKSLILNIDSYFLQSMKMLARQQSPDIRQIDLDVNRTYRDHIMFRERYGTKYES